ncbi:MAG: hypothetical protein ACE5IW_07175 [bacterium]
MTKLNLNELDELLTPQISSETLKRHIIEMLSNSSQCKAILESVNQDTGEYRIVLQGTLENNGALENN